MEFLELVASSSVDAIIAVDIFIYVGDLTKKVKSSYKAFPERSSFMIVTIEEMKINGVDSVVPNFDKKVESGLQLRECGIFFHSEKYVHNLAHGSGFYVISIEKQFVRLQSEISVRSVTFELSKI